MHTQRTMAARVTEPRPRAHLSQHRIVARRGIMSQAWPVVSQRTPGCVAAPYRSPGCAVSRHSQRPYLLPPCHDTIDCIVTHPQPDCPLVTIQRLYRDTTPQQPAPCLCHDTRLCIATLTPSQAAHARTADRIVAHARPCRGRALAISLPTPAHPSQPPQPCVIIQSIVS